MKVDIVVCDHCGCRVDYYDSDGDQVITGYIFEDDHNTLIPQFNVRTSCGTSGCGIDGLRMVNICSHECLVGRVGEWLGTLGDQTARQFENAVPVPNNYNFGEK